MASASSYERAVILAVFSLFALCVTFVIRKELHEKDYFEYQDTTRAKNEIDQSYELLIASSEQDAAMGNELKEDDFNATLLRWFHRFSAIAYSFEEISSVKELYLIVKPAPETEEFIGRYL